MKKGRNLYQLNIVISSMITLMVIVGAPVYGQ